MLIKDLLLWIIPFTICFFIANMIISFKRGAIIFILSLMTFETISNFTSVWYSFGMANLVINYLPRVENHHSSSFALLWHFPIPKPSWWSPDKGSLVGLLLGVASAYYPKGKLLAFISKGKSINEFILTKIFARLIPVFILGFIANLYQNKLLAGWASYSILLIWLLVILISYLLFLFFLSGGLQLKQTKQHIKNLLPAGSIALISGCSLSTMPWTIRGAAKNLQNPDFAAGIIPATTNIQQIGDCIVNTFLCFVLYQHFFGMTPDTMTWFTFSIAFVIARFAIAAVLGGAIFIMLPVYASYLQFTPEMLALMLTFNVLLDPLVTCTNVMANGALCRVFERVSPWMTKPMAGKQHTKLL